MLSRWRSLIVLLAVVAVTAACESGAAREADRDEPTIAVLRAVGESPTEAAFFAALRQAGFVPDRRLDVLPVDPTEAHPDPDDAAAALRRWDQQGADLVLALSSLGAITALETVPDTPVLFLSFDPVAVGLVEDEDRPEGTTGVTFRVPVDRTLDLVRRAIPDMETVGVIVAAEDPPAPAHAEQIQTVAGELGMRVVTASYDDPARIERAVGSLADGGADAILIATAPTAARYTEEVLTHAEARRLPVIANSSLADGALLVLHPDPDELGRQLGAQAVRLLSGSSPSSVPVEDPRRFRLKVDTTVASELGFEVPPDVLREADEVVLP